MRVLFIFFSALIILSACGKSENEQHQDAVLNIAGNPSATLIYEQSFDFIPQVEYTGVRALSFSIKNQPEWSSFDTTTGRLYGTAGSIWRGLYQDIEITVTDGVLTSALPRFSMEVTEQDLFSLSGKALEQIFIGDSYRFSIKTHNPENLPLVFSVENLPSWLSLDANDGLLTGVAKDTDIGFYGNITVTASYEDKTFSLAPFDIRVELVGDNRTYYVRNDGGDPLQCSGVYNRPLTADSGRNCALNSLFYVLGTSQDTNGIMTSGDTLIIAEGEYEIGYGAKGANGKGCNSTAWTDQCYLGAVPSGTKEQLTRVQGALSDGQCLVKPKLWLSGRSRRGINLESSNWVELSCIEITDKAECGGGHKSTIFDEWSSSVSSSDNCQRNVYPQGPYGGFGIYATDSSNVTIKDVDIHGLAYSGLATSRIGNWRLLNVTSSYNAQAGWLGDVHQGESNNHGYIEWIGGAINWNGCIEKLAEPGTVHDKSCTGQKTGNYADAVGFANTGGFYLFKNMDISHNVQDGLDLLYLQNTGRVTIDNIHATGNGGNAIKIGNTVDQHIIKDSTVIGNCAATSVLNAYMANDSATFCRALGQAIVVAGDTLVENVSVYSSGDGVFITSSRNNSHADLTVNDSLIYAGNQADIGQQDASRSEGLVALGWNDSQQNLQSKWTFNNTIIYKPSIYIPKSVQYIINGQQTAVDDICQLSTNVALNISGCRNPEFTELSDIDGPNQWLSLPSLTISPESPFYGKEIGDYK